MKNSTAPTPQRTSSGPVLAAVFGCLGIILLGVVILIVFGGIAYFQGYFLPPVLPPGTPTQTNTPFPTLTSTPTYTPSLTFTPSQTPTSTPSPTATIIFHPPTLVPTRTKTPKPRPTRTRTAVPTRTPNITVMDDTRYSHNFNTWIGLSNDQAIGRGMRCSSKEDELLSFDTSKGSIALSLFFYKGPNQGKAKITVDNILVETLDLYRVSPQYHFEWKYLLKKPLQTHKVRVVILHEKRIASTGYQVCFDGYKISNKFTDDKDYSIRYGTWSGAQNGMALGDGYRLSMVADSSVTFKTFGKSFHWITARGPNYGKAAIFVDAHLVTTVDLYFPTHVWQQSILVNNLGQGMHTVSIIVLGQNQPASGGTGIVFDGIRIP